MTWTSLTGLLFACGMVSDQFEIALSKGKPTVAAIESLAADGTIELRGGDKLAGGTWYSLRRSSSILPEFPRSPHVELANGDRIEGAVVEADGDAIRLRLSLPGDEQILRLPLSAVRVVWTVRRLDTDPVWLQNPRKRDVLQTRSGDLILGALTRINPNRNLVEYQADRKDQRLDFSKLAAIGFNSDLTRNRKPRGPYYRATLENGTRISLLSISFDGKVWNAQTLYKQSLRIPLNQLVALDTEQGKAVWLAELKPAKYHSDSGGIDPIPLGINRSVSDDFLRLKDARGTSTFDRGIGLHSDCSATYSLGEKYRRFEAVVGLDARSGTRGDAVMSVLVDGKKQELPRMGKLTLAGGPIELRIDITGAKELTIVIERASGGVVQDCVNLVEARLIP